MTYDPDLHKRAQFAKHFIGRHDQKTHARDQHDKGKAASNAAKGAAIGGGLLAAIPALAGGPMKDAGKAGAVGALLGALLAGNATQPETDHRKQANIKAAERNDAVLNYWEGGGTKALKDVGMTEADAKKQIAGWDLTDQQRRDYGP